MRSSLPWPGPATGWPPDGTPRPPTPWPPWPDPAAGSAAPTPSARSLEETRIAALVRADRLDEARQLLDARLDRRHSPRDRRWRASACQPRWRKRAKRRLIESPETVIGTSASGNVAGPCSTSPFSMEYLLPWQSQLMVPSETLRHEAALVAADRGEALELALGGLGDHDLLVGEDRAAADLDVRGRGQRVGRGCALGRRGLARRAARGAGRAGRAGGAARLGSVAVPESSLPHAASRGTPTPAAARPPRVRREILSVVMTAGSSRQSRVERVVERDTTYGLRRPHEEAL